MLDDIVSSPLFEIVVDFSGPNEFIYYALVSKRWHESMKQRSAKELVTSTARNAALVSPSRLEFALAPGALPWCPCLLREICQQPNAMALLRVAKKSSLDMAMPGYRALVPYAAACRGRLDMLQFAVENSLMPRDASLVARAAAEHGRKRALLLLLKRQQRISRHRSSISHSGRGSGGTRGASGGTRGGGGGGPEEKGDRSPLPPLTGVCEAAARAGRLGMVRFAVDNGFPAGDLLCFNAALHGHTRILAWLHGGCGARRGIACHCFCGENCQAFDDADDCPACHALRDGCIACFEAYREAHRAAGSEGFSHGGGWGSKPDDALSPDFNLAVHGCPCGLTACA
ncbi:unnamed protein product [Phaeothamnion confervicola]